MAQLFRQAALAYNQVEKVLKEKTSASQPLTIDELYPHCTLAKNKQQIADALRKFFKEHNVCKLRRGQQMEWWWKANNGKPVACEIGNPELGGSNAGEPLKPKLLLTTTKEIESAPKPEILVTKNSVVINSVNVKITVEF